MVVSCKDTVEVIERTARGYIVDYLSEELDPAVETELIGVRVYEVREAIGLSPARCQRFSAESLVH